MPTPCSVLYPADHPAPSMPPPEPACFRDLNLDQIVEAVTARGAEYDLAEFFSAPLRTADAIAYRHEVVRDLRRAEVRACVDEFAQGMRIMRNRRGVAAKMRYTEQRQRWTLDAAGTYRSTVLRFAQTLPKTGIRSAALRDLSDHLDGYVHGAAFRQLTTDIDELRADLAAIRYTIHIYGSKVTVTRYADEPDYGADIRDTFARFQQGDANDYHARFSNLADMNHVEADVLSCVTKLYPEVFTRLREFTETHADFAEETVTRFDREVQFYLAYLDHLTSLATAGLRFTLPDIDDGKHVEVSETFDLALADKLVHERATVVTNDILVHDTERVAVVTGANQGGKTTFARTVGQLHYLASLGLPVAGRAARLPLCDAVHTHFEKQEHLDDLRGKLEDDLVRIHDILSHATDRSLVILNEVFTSTTAADAALLGERILRQLIALDALGVYVTFIDELAALGPAVVSVVATVDPADPARRTFVVRRQPADGRAYAETLADHYGLSYDKLRKRVSS